MNEYTGKIEIVYEQIYNKKGIKTFSNLEKFLRLKLNCFFLHFRTNDTFQDLMAKFLAITNQKPLYLYEFFNLTIKTYS